MLWISLGSVLGFTRETDQYIRELFSCVIFGVLTKHLRRHSCVGPFLSVNKHQPSISKLDSILKIQWLAIKMPSQDV